LSQEITAGRPDKSPVHPLELAHHMSKINQYIYIYMYIYIYIYIRGNNLEAWALPKTTMWVYLPLQEEHPCACDQNHLHSWRLISEAL